MSTTTASASGRHMFGSTGLPRAWQRFLTWGAFAMLANTAVIAGYFMYMSRNPIQVLRVQTLPLRVVNAQAEVDRGQPIVFEFNYCKYVEATATLMRELYAVDGRDLVAMLPLTGGALPTGCHKILLAEPVPGYVPPGRYVLRITRLYRAGTFYDDPEIFETAPFIVR